MTLSRRDFFAGCALAGLLANTNKHGINGKQDYAETAIGIADALLAALNASAKDELVAQMGVEIAGVEKLQKRLAVRERQLELAKETLTGCGYKAVLADLEEMEKELER